MINRRLANDVLTKKGRRGDDWRTEGEERDGSAAEFAAVITHVVHIVCLVSKTCMLDTRLSSSAPSFRTTIAPTAPHAFMRYID